MLRSLAIPAALLLMGCGDDESTSRGGATNPDASAGGANVSGSGGGSASGSGSGSASGSGGVADSAPPPIPARRVTFSWRPWAKSCL